MKGNCTMYTNSASASAALLFSSASSASGSTQSSGDAFSSLLRSLRNNDSKSNTAQEMLAGLSERFPQLSFNGASAKTGETDSEAEAAEETADTAAIDENALAEMSASQSFSALVEKIIASFLDATQNASLGEGAYSVRSISISITMVNLSLTQVDGASGETLMSQDFQAAMQKNLDEMIKKMFGVGSTTDEEDETEESGESEAADEAAETARATNNAAAYGFGMGAWSLQLYYSQTLLAGGLNNQSGAGLIGQSSTQSWLGAFAMQGLTGILSGSGTAESLGSSLASLGIRMSNFSQNQSGFSLGLGSAGMLNALFDMLNQQRSGAIAIPATTEDAETDATAAAGTQGVEAAAGVAAE